jgi:hypothetical protein
MTKSLLPCLVAGLLLAGCSDHTEVQHLQAKVAALESRMSDLEARRIHDWDYTTNLNYQVQLISQLQDYYHEDTTNLEIAYSARLDKLDLTQDALRFFVTNRLVAGGGAAPPAHPASAYYHGVPTSVYESIAAQAAKDWPNDYQMQEFTINQQIEAYKKLHP